MRAVMLGMLALSVGGCVITDRPVVVDAYYTKADIDALNAETQCKALARTLVQVSRCVTRHTP